MPVVGIVENMSSFLVFVVSIVKSTFYQTLNSVTNVISYIDPSALVSRIDFKAIME